MKAYDFIALYIMPIIFGVIAELCKRTGVSSLVYNARKDEPMLLPRINTLLYTMREKVPNRHGRLDANIVLNGSLRSVGRDKLLGGTMRERLTAFLRGLVEHRPDVAKAIGCKTVADVAKLSNTALLNAYDVVSDGALNVEDYGFYRNSCDSKTSTYRFRFADVYSANIEKIGRGGEYRVTIADHAKATAKIAKAIDADEKRIAAEREKRNAEKKAADEKQATAEKNEK